MTSALEEDFGARLAFDRGAPGRWAVAVPEWDGPTTPLPAPELLRDAVQLPELSQGGLVRYYTALAARNFGVDSGPYPLGSCSMKYNPKVNDLAAGLPGFAGAHPLLPASDTQGTLQLLGELQSLLGGISGFPAVSLAAAAGAQGELSGILMIKKALQERGELARRRRVLVPDSAHGTNPATAAMAGFAVTQIATGTDGSIDRAALAAAVDESVAALMVTVPNTLGLWETDIEEVTRLVHEAGAYVYGDGANFNAIVGRIRFGDLGFDVVHLNVHKTFSTPHGGGGPGGGPVCAGEELAPYLPEPVVEVDAAGTASLTRPPRSIGRVQQFHGNVGVLIRAYAYIRTLGLAGLRAVSENAVLNAKLLADAPARPLRPAVRPAGAARGGLLRLAAAAPPRHPHPGHRQAIDRPRLPPAHHLLPTGGGGGVDDRAHGDGVARIAGALRGGDDRHRGGGGARPGGAAARAAAGAAGTAGRDPGGAQARAALVAGRRGPRPLKRLPANGPAAGADGGDSR